MTEIFFTLTTIYIAYVVYSIVNEQKVPVDVLHPELQTPVVNEPTKVEPKSEIKVEKKAKPSTAVKKAAPKVQSVTAKPEVLAAVVSKGNVRDPKTGEVATVGNNYRFTKRWIKEALVAEGLLDKVYKNNELDTAAEVAIKIALASFAELEKYRA